MVSWRLLLGAQLGARLRLVQAALGDQPAQSAGQARAGFEQRLEMLARDLERHHVGQRPRRRRAAAAGQQRHLADRLAGMAPGNRARRTPALGHRQDVDQPLGDDQHRLADVALAQQVVAAPKAALGHAAGEIHELVALERIRQEIDLGQQRDRAPPARRTRAARAGMRAWKTSSLG